MDQMYSPELHVSSERFFKADERASENFGHGSTVGSLAVVRTYVGELTEALKVKLDGGLAKNSKLQPVAKLLRLLDPELTALSALQTALHSVALEDTQIATSIALGRNVNHELWARDLEVFSKNRLDGLSKEEQYKVGDLAQKVDREVRRKHGNLKYRRQAARSIARKAGFDWHGRWTNEECALVGSFLLDLLLSTLPDVFTLEDDQYGEPGRLCITEGASELARDATIQAIGRNPVFLPSLDAPIPWTDFATGGPTDPRMQKYVNLVRTRHRETAGLVRAAIRSGQMQPAVDALNAIQATPWCINERVLRVMQTCVAEGIDVPGLPRNAPYARPVLEAWNAAEKAAWATRPTERTPEQALVAQALWDGMEPLERTFWKIQASQVKRANRTRESDLVSLHSDLTTAETLVEHERFYTPCNLDWRGRVYSLTQFHFQREDRVRGLFLFAEGEPIGGEGIAWLKVHTANCGDFEKISKRSFDDRLAWTDDNLDMVERVAHDPLGAVRDWMEADKPWLFLAACMELSDALKYGPEFVSSLPLNWDGSCSGLQHLCAMTRATEGALVNLTPGEVPQDVYQTVADLVAVQVEKDLEADSDLRPYAEMAMQHGVDRSLVKRNVMTYSYSSKKFGMAQQQVEDLMEPLALEVMSGARSEHPFGDSKETQRAAARYIAGRAHAAIEETVDLPAKAMGFLQSLARALAHEGKPLQWTTPTGLPWSNRYHPMTVKRIRLHLHDRGVSIRPHVAVGFEKGIDKERAASGVAPNFVHSLDAAHLMLTVLGGLAEGITSFALVHDSFGCLASRAARFHGIIREEFVRMYEQHDVLAEVLAQAKCDLSVANLQRLPIVPTYGTLNIKEVVNAQYAFA